jgi:phosphatidylinositol alpha-mannosyltransferase
MWVVMVCPYSLSKPGGVQGQTLGLTRCLRALGHVVTVVAPHDDHPPGAFLPSAAAGGAPTEDSSAERDGIFVAGSSIGLPANGSIAPVALSPRALARTLGLLRRGSPDVVHVHEPLAPTIAWACLMGAPAPVVGTFHRSGDSAVLAVLRPVLRWATSRMAARCAVSAAAAETALRALGGEIEVLFNGVEVDRLAGAEPWPSDRPTVLFLGRHEERKGLEVLLRAFAEVPGPATLWVGGSGPATDRLTRAYPPSDRLHWLGTLSDDEVARRLAGADVLCAPSLFGESFGMVLVEAMAARCAVVASDLPGYAAAAGGHATLVPLGGAHVLREALRQALHDAGARAGRSSPGSLDAAFAHASHWSMDTLAQRYDAIYARVRGLPVRGGAPGS